MTPTDKRRLLEQRRTTLTGLQGRTIGGRAVEELIAEVDADLEALRAPMATDTIPITVDVDDEPPQMQRARKTRKANEADGGSEP